MAESITALCRVFPFDQRGNHGEPHGSFVGRTIGQGESGGGSNTMILALSDSMAKGRIFLIKYVSYQAPPGGPDLFGISWGTDYFGGGANTFWGGVTVTNSQSVADFRSNINFLWIRPQDADADPTTLVTLTTPNVDTEDWRFTVQGFYWEQATLRKLGRGPGLTF